MLSSLQRGNNERVAAAKHSVFKDASATLELYENTVRCDTTSVAITITLPPVAEAAGLTFSIILETDGGNNVTVQDQDDSYNWSDLTFADALDRALLYSDGFSWWTLASVGI